MKKKFSLNPQSSNDQDSKIVVTKEQTNKFGILVDNVYEVKDINTSSIEMSKAITSAISGRYIEGLIKLEDNKIVILLNLSKVLTEEENQIIF
ncbi:purine-binding chemotaxis protein [compost metagenome]